MGVSSVSQMFGIASFICYLLYNCLFNFVSMMRDGLVMLELCQKSMSELKQIKLIIRNTGVRIPSGSVVSCNFDSPKNIPGICVKGEVVALRKYHQK